MTPLEIRLYILPVMQAISFAAESDKLPLPIMKEMSDLSKMLNAYVQLTLAPKDGKEGCADALCAELRKNEKFQNK